MVAVLAHALSVIGRDVYGRKEADPAAAAAAALFHDATEIYTGDMPTPIKYHGTVLTSAYKNVEKLAAEKLLSSLPDELKASYEPLLKGADDYTARVVKAADKLSAYIKCVEELKAGNAEFSLAAKQTREKLDAMDMPEVRYFLENFSQAFEMTLDELNFSVD